MTRNDMRQSTCNRNSQEFRYDDVLPRHKKMAAENNKQDGNGSVLLCLGKKKNYKTTADCVVLHSHNHSMENKGRNVYGCGAAGCDSFDAQSKLKKTSSAINTNRGRHFGTGLLQNMNRRESWHRGRRYLMCEYTSDISDAVSSDEYDMLHNKGRGSRRMRCQYRVNSRRVITSRRRVIRLLVVVLLAFALCVFPFHLKSLLIHWHTFPPNDITLDVLSPIAFLMLYMNSALNPILYWLFSDSFRRSFKETCCRQALGSCNGRRGR